MQTLKKQLQQIDNHNYKAYKKIEGIYQFEKYSLSIDHVQGDPFAIPSRISIRVPVIQADFPEHTWHTAIRRIALEDYLGRMVKKIIDNSIKGKRGSGCSGLIDIEINEQKTLLRNCILITKNFIEARLVIGLPADNRRVAGKDAQQMLFDELPIVIEQALYYKNINCSELTAYIHSAEDQETLRAALQSNNLVAFIANGSLLPRQSGISDKPMSATIIPFQSPPSMEIEINLPNAGHIRGMGIAKGVTLIVGGGFHGKSTLLHALEQGPYNHIPGDGREKVVSLPDAVKIRSEDGRAIAKVNIRPFIDRLPFARDTQQFSTENASGSTSQAANIIEAMECGSKLLLIDEDTSATNFMIRDERMQTLVVQEKEPITPLVFRIRELYEQHGISTIIVMGGSGDYFDIADSVIMMDEYVPKDVTEQAQVLAQDKRTLTPDKRSKLAQFQKSSTRKPGPATLDASLEHFAEKINVRETTSINYGKYRIDLAQVEQLIDIGQTRAIALMMAYYARHYSHDSDNLIANLNKLMRLASEQGLDIFSPYKVGNLAMPRLYELAAAINRIRCNDWQ